MNKKIIIYGCAILILLLAYKKRRTIMAVLNKHKLDSLNSDVKKKFALFISEMEKLGYTVNITSAYRSLAEQNELRKKDSRNAAAGLSAHNYGYAIDINLSKDGEDYVKATPVDKWKETGIVQVTQKLGLRWGGNSYSNYPDPVHIDATKKGDTQRWRDLLVSRGGESSLASVKANEISWESV
jgi:uncharacterized protein YcbK (DUF882 family)